MSNAEIFTNEAIPGIKTQVSVMKGSKSTIFIRDDMEGEEPSVIMLDYQTALKVANWIMENAQEVGEEQLYNALIKGHELIDNGKTYWYFDNHNDGVFVSRLHAIYGDFLTAMSKEEWSKLGINDSNADFVEVAE